MKEKTVIGSIVIIPCWCPGCGLEVGVIGTSSPVLIHRCKERVYIFWDYDTQGPAKLIEVASAPAKDVEEGGK